MTKQKTLKIDLGGQKVDVGIDRDLLAALGGMVYFGALAQIMKDRSQATFPETWTVEAPERADYATAVMAAFGSRVSQKIMAMPDSEVNAKILTGEVLAWAVNKFGIDMKEESNV